MAERTREFIRHAYTKLPGLIFWSGIHPTKPEGWQGTIIKKKGIIGMPQRVAQRGFGPFFSERIKNLRAAVTKGMSERQKDKITAQFLANPEKAVKWKSFEAFRAERDFRKNRR